MIVHVFAKIYWLERAERQTVTFTFKDIFAIITDSKFYSTAWNFYFFAHGLLGTLYSSCFGWVVMDQIPAAMDRHLEVLHCHKGMCIFYLLTQSFAFLSINLLSLLNFHCLVIRNMYPCFDFTSLRGLN